MAQKEPKETQELEELIDIKKIISDALPILLLSLLGSLLAGIVLGGMQKTLELVPGLIVVIPAMLDLRGNIYGALGSRLSTGLHQGILEPKITTNKNLKNATTASLINDAVVSFLLAIISWLILTYLNIRVIPLHQLILITLISGVISGLILTLIVTFSVYKSYGKRIDPDNIVGPIVTVTGDIFSIIVLFFVAKIITGMI